MSWRMCVVVPILLSISGLVVANGCRARRETREPSFREQLELVRAGQGSTITVGTELVGDAELELLREATQLRQLDAANCRVTHAGLRHLTTLPHLERLHLRGGSFDDQALQVLSQCTSLKNLNLPSASFGDDGLAALQTLPQLQLLRFSSPHVSDGGMEYIAALPSLRFLHVIGGSLTDEGLKTLEGMAQLQSLYVDDVPSITDDGIERLLKALPTLHFHRDQQHSDRDPRRSSHTH